MTFSLKIMNNNGNTVLDANSFPYRFIRMAEPPEWIQYMPGAIPTAGWMVPELTASSMLAIDVNGAKLRYKPGNLVYDYTGPIVVGRTASNQTYIIAYFTSYPLRQDLDEWITPPKLYVIDRTPPSGPLNSGFGLKVLTEEGDTVLSSTTPLVKVISNATVTTPAENLGNASSTLMFIHTPPPENYMGTIDYPGEDAAYVAGSYTIQGVKNGQHTLDYVEYFEEMGEGVKLTYPNIPLLISIVEKP